MTSLYILLACVLISWAASAYLKTRLVLWAHKSGITRLSDVPRLALLFGLPPFRMLWILAAAHLTAAWVAYRADAPITAFAAAVMSALLAAVVADWFECLMARPLARRWTARLRLGLVRQMSPETWFKLICQDPEHETEILTKGLSC